MPDLPLLLPLLDEMPVGVWVGAVPSGRLVYANERFAAIVGERAGNPTYSIHTRTGAPYPEDRLPYALAVAKRGHVTIDDLVIHRADGRRIHLRAEARPLFDAAGTMQHVIVAFVDTSRGIETEDRLRHAQKMESIGNLAGGVAHDFNNLLAAMKVLTSMLRRLETDTARMAHIAQLEQVIESATHLTRSLVDFARRGKNISHRFGIDEVAARVATLMGHTLDHRIVVATELGAAKGEIMGDFSQLEQVIMNLAVNARDAMPDGGKLTIRTREIERRPRCDSDAPPSVASMGVGEQGVPGSGVVRVGRSDNGRALVVEVLDTGIGIPDELRARVFEPYFTTKSGETSGTGLGLAMVYSIVLAHGGAVEVADGEGSGTNRGTLMRVTLPAADACAPARSISF